ncbi:putative glycosidase CRH2 [Entomophthora muscae]|uniref:Glycosidase CRH2 n=1 Tax=Entomophthora muscae TaxID=34485 RepID=A0ACC2U082_9FUNG|nr:putative glycosidase CRH2 [Entomophthora muscae]
MLRIFLFLGIASAGQNAVGTCTLTNSCDQWSPCCNNAGWCGATYDFCGAGCYEGGNFNSTKCLPKPSCSAGKMALSPKRIAKYGDFEGDFTSQDFTIEGEHTLDEDVVVLKLKRPGSGTTLRSTRYINFGRISADLTMSRVGGVVTSFITLSDTKDEVDFEWVGRGKDEIQTNWYYRGMMPDWKDTHMNAIPDSSSTHNYALDLTPSSITWLIDGVPVRTLDRTDDQFPASPTRFSFSIWDGAAGSPGTREWAGGDVDWEDSQFKKDGFFSLRISNIEVKCYGAATSNDSDFEMDSKFGMILKNTKPVNTPVPQNYSNPNAPPTKSIMNPYTIITSNTASSISHSATLLIITLISLI